MHAAVLSRRNLARRTPRLWLPLLVALSLAGSRPPAGPAPAPARPTDLAYPILFVTQLPIAADFTTIGSTFGNHQASLSAAGRGGDLWIRYPDGTLKNLTAAAGYGGSRPAGRGTGIAVRDPSVYWDGTKAVFSMVVGAPTQSIPGADLLLAALRNHRPGPAGYTGDHQSAQPAGQLTTTSAPLYGTDDRIIFTSDRPRNGQAHLYPAARRVRAGAHQHRAVEPGPGQRRPEAAQPCALGRLYARSSTRLAG